MSEPLPEKPHKSLGKHPRSIWSFYGHGFWKAFKKSFEKYGWAILICGLVYSISIPFIPTHIREEKLWGFDMNYWLTYAIPGTLLLLFLVYHLFRAPYEIYLETFEKTRKEIEEKETEIKTLKIEIQKNKEQPKPLEIEPFSTVAVLSPNPSFDQRVLAVKNNIADCTFEIHNRNPTHAIGDALIICKAGSMR